ncbi:hypothetical protein KUTeg_003364, partial [Tegillarca granosa]
VLAQETDKSPHGDTYIPASYFKWLEAGGCRTANDNGDYFPLWGTCLGFQLLTALTSGQNLLSTVDAENIMMPLNLEPGYNNSRLFGNLPHDVFKIITTRQYPFYGTQWHPEVNSYLWREDYKINHNLDATRIAQYITNFIVGEARKSNHRFPDFDTEVKSLINNNHPYFSADETLEEIYYFNYTKSDRNCYHYSVFEIDNINLNVYHRSFNICSLNEFYIHFILFFFFLVKMLKNYYYKSTMLTLNVHIYNSKNVCAELQSMHSRPNIFSHLMACSILNQIYSVIL